MAKILSQTEISRENNMKMFRKTSNVMAKLNNQGLPKF